MAYRRTEAVVARLHETRERIVDAALHLVARHGYGGTGIPAIAAEAGLSTGAIYRYFPSRRNCSTRYSAVPRSARSMSAPKRRHSPVVPSNASLPSSMCFPAAP